MSDKDLRNVLDRFVRDDELTATSVALESVDGRVNWSAATGDATTSTPFFIASTTKLYTTAIIMRLRQRGQLSLGDRVVDLIPGLPPLHVRAGVDSTAEITVTHLLTHTSGLPDYFSGKRSGPNLETLVREHGDRSWTFDDVLGWSAVMKPPFAPGTGRKASYSDTNFQLLGRIIEVLCDCSYGEALESEIFEPLGLANTWLYTDPDDDRPLPLRDGRSQLEIPKAMTSFGPDGGIVADSADLMTFVRGFFEAKLFDAADLDLMQRDFRRIMFPIKAGTGLLRFQTPRIMTPFGPPADFVGHSGLSGAFAYLAPRSGIYFAGTVNNIGKPRRPYQLMIRLLNAA